MQSFIISLMNKYGYAGIFFLITIENLFPPIPSEVILTMGGFLTTCTTMSVPGVIAFSTLGSLLGAIILYYLGKCLKKERLLRLVNSKAGRFLRLKSSDIEHSVDRFAQRGNKAVFLCRLVPILRSLISIPAGICEMHQGKFLLYTTLGSLLWNTILVTLGHFLGESWHVVSDILSQYSLVTKIILWSGLFLFLLRFYLNRKKTKCAASE
ncbi:MAG: DedA family protein [Lachnospiraceae bacterium]|nr:DedA family protein [Lachnospiraceae bacterium]